MLLLYNVQHRIGDLEKNNKKSPVKLGVQHRIGDLEITN